MIRLYRGLTESSDRLKGLKEPYSSDRLKCKVSTESREHSVRSNQWSPRRIEHLEIAGAL